MHKCLRPCIVVVVIDNHLSRSVTGDLVLPRFDCCACTLCGSVYCASYVRMCEWFFECTMRVLVGFRGVGWPVRWRHLSATWPISTAEMSLSVHWELSQSVIDTLGTVRVI